MQNLALAKQMYPGQIDLFLNQYEEDVKRPFHYLLIDMKTTNQDNCRLLTNVLPSEEGSNQAGFQENIPQGFGISKPAKTIACPASFSYARNTG